MRQIRTVHALPTLVSLGNLLCGFGAISMSLRASGLGVKTPEGAYALYLAAMCVCFAMVMDLLDGRIARMTGGVSRFGAELDSIADIVSFGVAPAIVVKVLVAESSFPQRASWALLAAFAVFAALRLARYNVEKNSQPGDKFSGLPSPAAAGAVVSVVLLGLSLSHFELRELDPGWIAPLLFAVLPVYMLVLGLLMVSRVRYAHLGRLLLSGRKPFEHMVVLTLAAVLAWMQLELTLSVAFTLYVLAGPLLELRAAISRSGAKEDAAAGGLEEDLDEAGPG
jgi:CDP-diacylglycerol--serine O-phosphatidyltransferase